MRKYYQWTIERKGKTDILEAICDYLTTTLYEDAQEIDSNEFAQWVEEFIGCRVLDTINFITCEDNVENISVIYYLDMDGSIKSDVTGNVVEMTELTVEVNQSDYDLLEEWGFDFDSNIDSYLHGVANEMRECIKKGV